MSTLSSLTYEAYYLGSGEVLTFDHFDEEQEFRSDDSGYILNNNGEVLLIKEGVPHLFTAKSGFEKIDHPKLKSYNYEIQNFTDDEILGWFYVEGDVPGSTPHAFAYRLKTREFIDFNEKASISGVDIGNSFDNIISFQNGAFAIDYCLNSCASGTSVAIYDPNEGFTLYQGDENLSYSIVVGNMNSKLLIEQRQEDDRGKNYFEHIIYDLYKGEVSKFNLRDALIEESVKNNFPIGKRIKVLRISDEGVIFGQMYKNLENGYGFNRLPIAFSHNTETGATFIGMENDSAFTYPVISSGDKVLLNQFNTSKKKADSMLAPFFMNLDMTLEKIPFDFPNQTEHIFAVSHNSKGQVLALNLSSDDISIESKNSLLIWDPENGTQSVFDLSQLNMEEWSIPEDNFINVPVYIGTELHNRIATMNENGDILVTLQNDKAENYSFLLVLTDEN